MISSDILFALVPSREPDDDFPREPRLLEIDPDSPGHIISSWSQYLRYQISRELAEDKELEKLLVTSGFLATGIFRLSNSIDTRSFEEFPVVSGYQFGAVLLRGARVSASEGTYLRSISLEYGRFQAPLIQTVATFNPHAFQTPDGFVAVVYEDDDLEDCGITASHVVEKYRIGQRVPVVCSACGAAGKLAARAPGFIDAAKITFPCGGPGNQFGGSPPVVRSAAEGETVEAHFGDTGQTLCTIMLSLSTPSQIKGNYLVDVPQGDSYKKWQTGQRYPKLLLRLPAA